MASAKVDLSEFYRLSRPKKPPCKVGFALSQLKGDVREQLEAALGVDKGIITAGAIREWLASRKHDVSNVAIANHRNGICDCKDES